MQALLILFGWTFIVFAFCAILVPYLRGHRDLVTSWNLFLLGAANFVGLASVQSGNSANRLRDFSTTEHVKFFVATVLFWVIACFAYYTFQFPRRWARRRFRKWPPATTA